MSLLSRRDLFNRTFLGVAAAMTVPRPALAQTGDPGAAASPMIDGLGFPGGASSEDNARLSGLELQHIQQSGLSATHLTVGAVGSMPPLAAFEKTVRDLSRWEREIDDHPTVLSRVRTAADITAAASAGTTGLIYGLQDGVLFEDDLDRLTALHQLGVRVVQPTYNRRNLLGDGCMEPADAGLSRAGREAIERLNELGILVDLSHCGRASAADAIAAASRPVSFTHTGCDALIAHPRHRTDSEIRAVAEGGGVTGIFIMPYLARGRQPGAADVLRHLDHAIDVAGEDHVAIGTDGSLSPTTLTPEFIESFRRNTRERAEQGIAAPHETETGYLFANDLNTPDRFATLAGLMRARGHSARRVEKILGGNLLRLFADAW
jgi:membrane dipeptidase